MTRARQENQAVIMRHSLFDLTTLYLQ